jgi:GntR family transcriptional repressor for pyruvate dehydrogenase complex
MSHAPKDALPGDRLGAQRVVNVIREWIERGKLKRGDQLLPERELALQLGVSRPTVRAGLRSLVTMGVLESRHGMGTFITDRPPALGNESLSLLAALHGFTRDDMFGARRILEVGAAMLAAEAASPSHLAALSEEVTGMFASLDDKQQFLVHDRRFHGALAAASGNPVLAALVEMLSTLASDQRDASYDRARHLKEAAQMHLKIYQAIRARDADAAGALMKEHLALMRQPDRPGREAEPPQAPDPPRVASRRRGIPRRPR